jgi:hypothetical protein
MSEKKRQKKAGQNKGKRNQARRRANAKPAGFRGNGSGLAGPPFDAADMQPDPKRRRGTARVAQRSTRASATASRASTSVPPAVRRKAAREAKGE